MTYKLPEKGYIGKLGYHITAVKKGKKWVDVLTHRIIMEEFLGRKLHRSEHVHHLDHNKLNNAIENLEILTAKEHALKHMVKSDPTLPKKCRKCLVILPAELFSKNQNGSLRSKCKPCRSQDFKDYLLRKRKF